MQTAGAGKLLLAAACNETTSILVQRYISSMIGRCSNAKERLAAYKNVLLTLMAATATAVSGDLASASWKSFTTMSELGPPGMSARRPTSDSSFKEPQRCILDIQTSHFGILNEESPQLCAEALRRDDWGNSHKHGLWKGNHLATGMKSRRSGVWVHPQLLRNGLWAVCCAPEGWEVGALAGEAWAYDLL